MRLQPDTGIGAAARSVAFACLLLPLLAADAAAQRGTPAPIRTQQLADPSLAPRQRAYAPEDLARAKASLPRFQSGNGRPAIVLTGYWPPSNEAVRRFSPDPAQNPLGWLGSDWEGRGYDVYAFFPEFSPPDCSNCGRGSGDLEVDYQDTTFDYWPIVDTLQPIAVITTSRGFSNRDWELEMNQYNRFSWIGDYAPPYQPTPAPPDVDKPVDYLRNTSLPVQDIVNAILASGVNVNPFICFSGSGGGFLSEFIAYLGVWYRGKHASPADADWCVAAGHVHIGGQVDWPTAQAALEITLRTVITHVDGEVAARVCQPDLGFGGPGSSVLAVCGDALATGGRADLLLTGGAPGAAAWLVVGPTFQPTAWNGGLVVPVPPARLVAVTLDADGRFLLPEVPGGRGPRTLYVQAVHRDTAQAQGWGISNALRVEFLP
ncbi:MAG TPA: hypothetical protein VGC54_14095 [Planctomycetota bacterium]